MMSALHVGQSFSSVDPNNDNNNDATAKSSSDARFSCNICFDAVTEPVVTRCGHLYCFPCLYRWLAPGMTPRERASLGMRPNRPSSEPLTEGRRVCPVCKSECSVASVVPIYVRNDDDTATAPEQPLHPTLEQPQSPPVPLTDENMSEGGNMGLDIDEDYPDNVLVEGPLEHHDPLIPTSITTMSNPGPEPSPPPAGLRQRRREQDNGEDIGVTSTAIVPTRQMLLRDRAATAETNSSGIPQRNNTPNTGNNNNNGPTPNHHARATLSYGLVLAMYQMFLNATNAGTDNDNGNGNPNAGRNNPDATEAIPSLHYPQQRRDSTNNMSATNEDLDSDPAATIFLSRLLLLLSLFVLVCLLLF